MMEPTAKTEAVLRLLRGESFDQVARDFSVPVDRLAAWSRAFVHGGEMFLSRLDAVDRPPPRSAILARFAPGVLRRPSYSSPRFFRPVDYRPGNRRLVLRSPRVSPRDCDIDLRFDGAFYAELIDTFAGVTLAEPTADELAFLERRAGQPANAMHFYFAVITNVPRFVSGRPTQLVPRRLFVGASHLTIEEV
jgi:hypothetical protein